MNLHDFEQMFRQGIYVHRNKTKTYLAAVMSEYGKDYTDKMREAAATGVFVDDALADIDDTDHCLFFLFNVYKSAEKGLTDFNQFVKDLQELNFYVHDYPFGELFGGKLHVVVFRIPEKYYRSYDIFTAFKKGKNQPVPYSKMYDIEDIENIFVKLYGNNERAVKVFRKDPKWKEQFEEEINRYGAYVNKYQNVDWIILDPERDEYEYLPIPREEILNYDNQ